MVRDCWYVILESREVPARRPVGVVRLGQRLVLWRDEAGQVAAVADRCPHRGAALSPGRVVDGCVECFFHGLRFDRRGACTAIPAHGPDGPVPKAMRTPAYEVRERDGWVFLWWGEPREAYPPLPGFDQPDERFAHASFHEDWPTHVSRVVENQLDFTHLPFTHRRTIGRGVPQRLDVLTEVDGDRIEVRYDPQVWAGAGAFFVELIAPNLWRNRLSDRAWVVAAFVPIDDEHTRTYLRFYQRFVTLPGLGGLVCRLANLFNRRVLAEDRARVLSQRPLESALRGGEVLVPSDRPIVEYRRWRERRGAPVADAD